MLHTIDPSILFLKQEEEIEAGVLDMKKTLQVCEKVYSLLGQGQIYNPPKTHIGCPIGSTLDHWDSFFNTMPCLIGGDVNIGGVKWASEANANSNIPGIPYGIDITVLSDPATVLPYCILDGTLITAMRTSAVAGLFAKYGAPSNTTAATLVGAGVIGRTMIFSICETVPNLKTIYLCDLNLAKAEELAAEYGAKVKEEYGVEIIPCSDSKAAAEKSQLIVGETTARSPFMTEDWLQPGKTIINMNFGESSLDTIMKADVKAADYWKQLITFDSAGIALLHKQGKLEKKDVLDLSEIVLGTAKLRENDDQMVLCQSLGLGALDIMIAHETFLAAQKLGIGTTVKMWDKPLWE